MRAHLQLIINTSRPDPNANLYTVWFVDPVLGLVLGHEDETLVVAELPGLETAINRVGSVRHVVPFGRCKYEAETRVNPGGDILIVRVRPFSSMDRELGEARHVLVGNGTTTELVPRPSNEATAWRDLHSLRWFDPNTFLNSCSPIDRRKLE